MKALLPTNPGKRLCLQSSSDRIAAVSFRPGGGSALLLEKIALSRTASEAAVVVYSSVCVTSAGDATI
jgi:hypothetical protein